MEKHGLPSTDALGLKESLPLYVVADIATSFTVLVGIFFPSVTGEYFLPTHPALPCLPGEPLRMSCFWRHYGWLKPLRGPPGCPEVHSCGDHSGHCYDLPCVYPFPGLEWAGRGAGGTRLRVSYQLALTDIPRTCGHIHTLLFTCMRLRGVCTTRNPQLRLLAKARTRGVWVLCGE